MSKNTCYHCWKAITKIDLMMYDVFEMVLEITDGECENLKTLFKYYDCDVLCISSYHLSKQHKVKYPESLHDVSMKDAHVIDPDSICRAFEKVHRSVYDKGEK